jgi:carboxypeptidase Taq
MSFSQLDQLCRRLEAMDHAQAMLGVDEAVNMPEGGGEKRAEAMAIIASMSHEMASAPRVAEWIAKAEAEALDQDQKVAVAAFKRAYINLTCLTSDFVARQVNARLRCEQLWRALRPANDWAEFLPSFENIVALAREEASRRAAVLGLSPYDALVEQYDPGSRSADISRVFGHLKAFLKGFIPEALDAQARRRATRPLRPLAGPFAIDIQKALGLELMKTVGFDFRHGRLDVSHHPFCGGVPSDVRMTTRYREDEFLSSLMGILHETGHGLYEQNLPHDLAHWPSTRARGMAMHESQSLFQEMQLSRRAEFWQFALPRARAILGLEPDLETADMLAHVHRVQPGFIRVDADEATYPLHVILRYELEQDLIAGKLEARDVPDAWDAKMRDYLGLSTAGNYRDGPMQDVHWPSGAFGYFPSYTLGAMMAAQQWAAVERHIPDAAEQIARGEFAAINAWRKQHIWSQASRLSTPEIMIQATGEPLNARHFEEHLKRRYLI